jgi:hypothetical protein
MSDTPETIQALDAILREHGELHEDTAPAILVRLCKKLERERDEARAERDFVLGRGLDAADVLQDAEEKRDVYKNQLARICKEGFGNQDTIGLEPADDYVLRKLAEMRKVIRQTYYDTETYADGAPDASAHDKLCNEISSKLEPFIKP